MSDDVERLVDEATERGQLRRDLADTREKLRITEAAMVRLKQQLDLSEAVAAARPSPPTWLRTPPRGKHPATPVFLLTDCHFDEVVRPEEILGLNKYDRTIAMQRLERAYKGCVKVARDYVSGHTYGGMVLLLGGDFLSGEIHTELIETNEGTVVESLIHWLEPMIAGVQLLAEEFGKVHIAGVVGNHGRRTRKPRSKLRAKDNYDWLLYRLMQRELSKDKRVTVDFPEGPDVLVPVHDTRLLLTHGDQFRGGSGISAALSPMLLGEHRKTKKHVAASRYGGEDLTFDLMMMGHYHQRYILPRTIVGGCLVGYGEYAFVSNLDFQPPSQELVFVAPERGVILNAPVWVQNRQLEKW